MSKVVEVTEKELEMLGWGDEDTVQLLVDVETSTAVIINHSKNQRDAARLKELEERMDFVKAVRTFNDIAGTKEVFDARKIGLYTGLVLEEVAEMLDSFENDSKVLLLSGEIDALASRFKSGEFDHLTTNMNRAGYLDAAVDIAVVALGAGVSVGADIEGACLEVTNANLAKFPIVDGKYTVLRDVNGKVRKPQGWTAPNTGKYLHD